MAGATIAQPRNPVLDMIEAGSKGLPLIFGSKSYTDTSGGADAGELAQSHDMINQFLARSSSTAQADQIVQDILYRAQLAFAPILGEEKQAGVYNSTVKAQLAHESVARATAASAQAVLQDQQQAAQAAVALQNQNTAASKKTSTVTKNPGQGRNALLTALALNAPALAKKAKGAMDAFGASDGTVNDNYVGDLPEFSDSNFGALTPTAGGESVGGFAANSFGGSSYIADDTAALQDIIDSTVIPGVADGTLVADAGTSTTDVTPAGAAPDLAAAGFSPALIDAGTKAGISAETMQTIGPIATQKAIESAGATMPPAIPLGEAGLEGVGDLGDTAVEGAPVADASVEAGSEIAGDAVVTGGAEAAGDAAATAGAEVAGETIGDYYFPGAFTVANYATEGQLGDAAGQVIGAGVDVVSGTLGTISEIGDAVGNNISDFADDVLGLGGNSFDWGGDFSDTISKLFG